MMNKKVQIDSEIIKRCQQGDKMSFRWIVQTYQRLTFSLALKMLCYEEEAKDTVQETFIRVWQHICDYDPRRSFTTWLYTITTRLCLDRLKRAKRITAMPDDELVVRRFASNSDSQRVLENQEWVALVRTMAECLSDKQRLVFTLCQLEGLSSEEAQEITGLDARQVKSNLYAARQTIRKQLKALGYE
jgi:RNA polymerase sigma-70 factor (ECF subfamily)